MRIQAIKPFISTSFGNVTSGQILETSDAVGLHLIQNKLAEKIENIIISKPIEHSNLEQPIIQKDGSLSQVAEVSQKETVKPHRVGKGKVRK